MNVFKNVDRAVEGLDETRLYTKVSLRLIPCIFLCYVVSYLDRVNVGFARLQMLSDLHFSESVYGLGAGIFFIGYFAFSIPSNILLEKFGARRWISFIMITWGLVSTCMLFVKTPTSFYALRFLLGLSEAGFFPGVILYLTYWYPSDRRGRVMGAVSSALAVSGVIGGLSSGWIMQFFGGVFGLKSWQWLFLLDGLPSVFLGAFIFVYLNDRIADAKWLTDSEKNVLQVNIDRDAAQKQHFSIKSVLASPMTFFLAGIDFAFIMGLYGISFWLPTIVRHSGAKSYLDIGIFSSIPYLAAVVMMLFVTNRSDRKRERRWHLAIPAIIGGAGLIASVWMSAHLVWSVVALSVATAGIITTLPLFWSLPTAFLGGPGAAAGIAAISSTGNLAGFFSPIIVGAIVEATKSTDVGLFFLAGLMFVGALMVLSLPSNKVNR